MTYALCFNCGEVKFGSFCACPNCSITSCGDMALDMDFSDHVFSKKTLQEFGVVIKAISSVCKDQETRLWTFIYYLSKHHPKVMQVKFIAEKKAIVDDVLSKVDLPEVTIDYSKGDI
jgi:hypothetical protein